MSRIFISYSRRDSAYANLLFRALSHLDVSGFLDQADIAAGASWQASIKEAIRDADVVIVILSENSIQSNFVMAEVGVAWSLDKHIIPVIPPGASIPKGGIPPILLGTQFLDANQQTPEETANLIVQAMQR